LKGEAYAERIEWPISPQLAANPLLISGIATCVLTYDGKAPGPDLRRKVVVKFRRCGAPPARCRT